MKHTLSSFFFFCTRTIFFFYSTCTVVPTLSFWSTGTPVLHVYCINHARRDRMRIISFISLKLFSVFFIPCGTGSAEEFSEKTQLLTGLLEVLAEKDSAIQKAAQATNEG